MLASRRLMIAASFCRFYPAVDMAGAAGMNPCSRFHRFFGRASAFYRRQGFIRMEKRVSTGIAIKETSLSHAHNINNAAQYSRKGWLSEAFALSLTG